MRPYETLEALGSQPLLVEGLRQQGERVPDTWLDFWRVYSRYAQCLRLNSHCSRSFDSDVYDGDDNDDDDER